MKTLTPERRNILSALSDGVPRRPSDIAKMLDKSPNSLTHTMQKMVATGHLEQTAYGYYVARKEEPMTTITEKDIIEARQRVVEAERKGEQQDFRDALLASPDLTPQMVREWLGATPHVNWCACEKGDHSRIVCTECGLPPYWASVGASE